MSLRTFKDANSLEARQALLDRRCERTHPKRHRTLKRSRAVQTARKAKGAAKVAAFKTARKKFLAKSRAYWRGETTEHP